MNDFYDACINGNLAVVSDMFADQSINLNWGFHKACCHGHLDIVKFLLDNGILDWNNGVYGACYNGRLNIVNYLIQIGSVDLDFVFEGACYGGHLLVVIRLIELGAYEYKYLSSNPSIMLLLSNKRNLGGNEDELLTLGIPPTILEYSPAYIELNKQRKQECVSAISEYLIYDMGKIVADYAYY